MLCRGMLLHAVICTRVHRLRSISWVAGEQGRQGQMRGDMWGRFGLQRDAATGPWAVHPRLGGL